MSEPLPTSPATGTEMRRRFAIRTERFSHGGWTVDLLLPRAADELIDESEFNTDERLPYWAELWPSARTLARHLLDEAPPAGRVVELGCGVALPSLALRSRGGDVLATDYYADALDFASVNASRNELAPLATRLVDWRTPPPDLGRFELVIAADVLYERRNADALADLLPRLLAPGGTVLLADPGRVHLPAFRERMTAGGWTIQITTRNEPAPTALRGEISISLLRLERSG